MILYYIEGMCEIISTLREIQVKIIHSNKLGLLTDIAINVIYLKKIQLLFSNFALRRIK